MWIDLWSSEIFLLSHLLAMRLIFYTLEGIQWGFRWWAFEVSFSSEFLWNF
jgi:hypothetical protein